MEAPKQSTTRDFSHPLRWFPEFLDLNRKRLRPQARVLGLSLVVGVIAGLGSVLFYVLSRSVFHYTLVNLAGYSPGEPGGETPLFGEVVERFHPWLLLVIPTIGGLISGFLVYTFAPEAEGHGTDAAIAAYHQGQGNIRPRVPLIKLLASAVTLGTGGSGGREGPIAQIGAGFGSWVGKVFRLRPVDRRILLAAGMGAGIAAIFRAPLAGAIFAAEVLYRSPDFESEVIIPAGLASVVAYCTFASVFNFWTPLFSIAPDVQNMLSFNRPLHLLSYTLLALLMVVLAMFYTRSFYGITRLFHRVPIRPHFKPAIGAFLTGALGLAFYYLLGEEPRVLAVLGVGYGMIQDAMVVSPAAEGSLFLALILTIIAIGKIVTTGLTIGSGGSGGVFGPSMVIGGCGGGALGIVLHKLSPGLVPHPACFVIVGMAGFFAAAAKTPFSTLVIVSEMTGNYNLLLPTLWVCAVTFLLSDEQSIYSSQVESRSRSPAHQGDFVRELLTGLVVDQFVTPRERVPVLQPGDNLGAVIDRLGSTNYTSLPVTDPNGRYLGVISLEEVHLASRLPNLQAFIDASDLMRLDIAPLQSGDRLDRALELFVESNLLELPVVDGTPEHRVVGIVTRSDVSSNYLKLVQGMSESKKAAAG